MATVMESRYAIDTSANLIRFEVWGELTAESLIELLDQVRADPRYVPGMHALGDYREAYGNWDYSEIQRFRDYLMHIAVPCEVRWAALFRPGNLAAAAHVLILISEAVGSDIKMRMFEEPAAAMRWMRGEDRPGVSMSHEFLSGRVEVRTGDITGLPVDAVVNAANSTLLGGAGVDGAIHRRGGQEILRACRELRETCYPQGLPAGEAVLTTAGNLPARYVIHTVGPIWGRDQQAGVLLASCYRKSLALAANHALESVAFPAISTGAYGFPKEEAAAVASTAICQALAQADAIERVSLVFFSDADRDVFLANQQFG
ncbi:O-acetyl-ADP-ribose deacetylase [Steroidobacter sp.]|uniref:O-acetyl-ADP-ribose deacetylase n=1 Tax=Steroidobacter sp. TaxID=1978227 RepID=UPI001A5974A1|nr:O-acetyl-ADP-ribose deacetylase [Steroidobacter sp.]MBL8265075.1 O-acetyl-ADP-ribose deacetylase [Steroidobacter sp.]